MLQNTACIVVTTVAYISSICALMCCRYDKKVPVNYILLAVFTVATGFMVSMVCVRTDPKIVLEAASLTLAVTVAITLYAMTTTTDFTIYGPLLHIFGMVFVMAGFLMAVFGADLGLLWSVIGVILFSFYLLFDTQMIMGGDKKRY